MTHPERSPDHDRWLHAKTNPRCYAIISRFKVLTRCPVIVNTSLTVRGEPIVCTPDGALRCFMGTEIDVLVAGTCFLRKEAQSPHLKTDYASGFDPD